MVTSRIRPEPLKLLAAVGLWLAVCLALTAPAAAQEQKIRRHALLVGIADYPQVSNWSKLEGTIADVEEMKTVLIERAGFEEQTIKTLIDEQATKQGILDGLDDLVNRANPGDVILFFYAGHGSWANDVDGDELFDAADETLVPFDAFARQGAERDVLDDQLRDFIVKANKKTNNVILIFDSCASGTVVRGSGIVSRHVPGDGPQPRGIGGKREGANAIAPMTFAASDASGENSGTRRTENVQLSYVSLSACRADEKAHEIRVEKGKVRRGLFTMKLAQCLRDAKPGMTYSELMEQVRWEVSSRFSQQNPAVEGSLRHQSLFAGGVPLHRNFFTLQRVSEGSEESITLNAGSMHGLTAGDRLLVCPSGTLAPGPEVQTIGELELTSVGATTSPAKWIGNTPSSKQLVGARVFLWQRAPRSHQFTVSYRAANGPVPAEESDALHEAAKRTPQIRLTPEPDGNFTLVLANKQWTLHDASNASLPIHASASKVSELADLMMRLDHLGHADALRMRTRNEVATGIQFETSFEKDGKALAAGVPSLTSEDWVSATISNLNDFPIYATLILFSPDGDVYVLGTCETKDDAIPAGASTELTKFQLYAPDETVPFYKNQNCTIRWIVSRQYHDLRPLQQGPVTSTTRSGGNQAESHQAANSVAASPLEQWATAGIECHLITGG